MAAFAGVLVYKCHHPLPCHTLLPRLVLACPPPPALAPFCRLVTVSKEGAQRRLITPEEHPVFWDELPAPVGMVV